MTKVHDRKRARGGVQVQAGVLAVNSDSNKQEHGEDEATTGSQQPSNVEVFRDGIKIGWTVLAILATAGLSLYVTNVISPLIDGQKRNHEEIVELRHRSDELRLARESLTLELQEFKLTSIAKIGQLEKSNEQLEKEIEAIAKKRTNP